MIANAMFYGTEGTEDRPVGIKVGIFKFTLGQLFTSLMAVLIVTPINIFIINMFKRARPRIKNFEENFKSSINRPRSLIPPPTTKRKFSLCFWRKKDENILPEVILAGILVLSILDKH